LDWLRHQAGTGNVDALAAPRRRGPTRDVTVDRVNGSVLLRRAASARSHDSVNKLGTIIYRVGASAVRDEGDTFRVSRGPVLEAMQAALRIVFERFGKRITVKGSDAFKEQIGIAAAAANMLIVFDDPALEQRRLQFVSRTTRTESSIDDVDTRPSHAAAKDLRR
jgi:hypothetical protein